MTGIRHACLPEAGATTKGGGEPPLEVKGARPGRRPLQNLYFDLDGLAFAFPTLGEPGGKAFGKTLGSEAKAGFEAAIGGRECVVKVGGVGEIAHGELIEPFERTRAPLPANHHFHLKFLRVHRV